MAVAAALGGVIADQPRRAMTSSTTASATAGDVDIPVERMPAAR